MGFEFVHNSNRSSSKKHRKMDRIREFQYVKCKKTSEKEEKKLVTAIRKKEMAIFFLSFWKMETEQRNKTKCSNVI